RCSYTLSLHDALPILSKLFFEAGVGEDFSKLPIPFFCIATDIETGEGIVLDRGNLAQSVLASGALPSLFQPVVMNDRILIDGGVDRKSTRLNSSHVKI